MLHPLDMSARSQDDVVLNVNSSVRTNNTTATANQQIQFNNNNNNNSNSSFSNTNDRLGLVANSYQNRMNTSNNVNNTSGMGGTAMGGGYGGPGSIVGGGGGNNDGYYSTGNMRESSIGAGPGIYEPDTRSIGSTPSKISKFTYSGKHFIFFLVFAEM
jgi:hypothetical protein